MQADEDELTGLPAFVDWFVAPFCYVAGYVYGFCVVIGRYLLTGEIPDQLP